jgi:choline dehydrogenase
MGNQGWSYADVLPLFKRMESYAGGGDSWPTASASIGIKPASASTCPSSKPCGRSVAQWE